MNPEQLEYAGNFVAVPFEELALVQGMMVDAKPNLSTPTAQESPLISLHANGKF